jgi:hypothetical protein
MNLYPKCKPADPVIAFEIIEDVTEEVVTLQQAKDWLTIDYPDWDWLIEMLIKAAREECEKFTGLSIGVRKIKLTGDYENELVYMPFEPITEKTGNEQRVGYTADTCPSAIKLAILRMVHTHFEFRNDIEKSGVSMLDVNADKVLKPFRRRVGL